MRRIILLWCCFVMISLSVLAKPSGQSLILMGPPGAGKGTQADYLKQRYHLRSISIGALLREQVQAGTALGKQVEATMNSGELVSDEIVFELLGAQLDSLSARDGILLDGFPRSQSQALQLDKLLTERKRSIGAVILLELSDEQVMHRLTQRAICPTCQRSYHLSDNPPQTKGLCDDDLTPLIERSDDQPDVIARRLQDYHESTEPVAEYYRERKLLQEVDAEQSIEAVRADLIRRLDPLLLGIRPAT